MRIFLLMLALLVAPLQPVAAQSTDHPWDATWVGDWDSADDDGVQVIVTGDQVVGFFIHGDYVEPDSTAPLAADGSLAFTWPNGKATLRMDGDARELVVDENGHAERVVNLTQGD
ncbi:MAG TPA: hypothetical protein VG894_05830 [Bauldia sp.]|nr:hypothetical protein [Bauldia sp.]